MPAIVFDPVCVSTPGHTLLREDALGVLTSELLPISTLITPNKSEAELLFSQGSERYKIETSEDMVDATKELVNLISRNNGEVSQDRRASVLLKGGHPKARD